MVLTIAGSDTTASTLVALTYHVLSTPSIFARLRAELDDAIPSPDQAPDPKALDALSFLNALIEEALRMYPSATHRQDRVAPDTDLIYTSPSGSRILIPRGTIIGMTAPLLNRSPQLYTSPDTFSPDRYLDNPALKHTHFTFGAGARKCLGLNLAYQELQTFTAGVFRKYAVFDPQKADQGGPTMQLFETEIEDVRLHADYVTPGLRPGGKGVRVVIRN
jgi:cytochrome P450